MRWLDDITDSMDVSLSELREMDEQGGPACCDSWGHKESDMTEQLSTEHSADCTMPENQCCFRTLFEDI